MSNVSALRSPLPETVSPMATKWLSAVTGILVALLAAGAFALSFDSLNQLAVENGVTMGLTWVWPLVLDGSIVVFSLSALRSRLHAESVRYPMTLVVLTTGASVVFNVAHAPEGPLAHTMAAVPPLALFLAFELLMRQVGSSMERASVLSSQADLVLIVDRLEAKRDKLEGQIEKLSTDISARKADIRSGAKGGNPRPTATKKESVSTRRSRVKDLHAQEMPLTEMAKLIGVSTKTIQRDLRALSA